MTLPILARGCLLLVLASLGGCTLFDRSKASETEKAKVKQKLAVPKPPELIRGAAVNQGLQSIRIDGVGVVNALGGSGGPSKPSPFRDLLIEEMKRNDVPNPERFLESNDTAMVQIQAVIPPGAQRGDPLDLRIVTPVETAATDLHAGWLLDTRLRHQQVIRGAIRSSEVMGMATGPVLTRAAYDPTPDDTLRLQGIILSGGAVQADRHLGLVLRPEFQHVQISKAIADAVNRRFFFFDGSARRGIAKAIEDDFIQVDVHPRYRQNEIRMMEVVRSLSVAAESSDTQKRLVQLGTLLSAPHTAADAAIQLEGLGESGVPTLVNALPSQNPEIRFYVAEALAFLDRPEAIDPLVAAARDEPAFRGPALEALSGLKHPAAVDGLRSLLDEPSLETRYGAFVAIRKRSDAKATLKGEKLNGTFQVYQVPSLATPAIVVSLKQVPEIVLFGKTSDLFVESHLMGTSGLMIRIDEDGKHLRMNRFQPGKEDQHALTDASVASVLRGVTQVGGGYGDAIALLRIAKEKGVLRDQLAIDPLPAVQRTYHREMGDDDEPSAEKLPDADLASK